MPTIGRIKFPSESFFTHIRNPELLLSGHQSNLREVGIDDISKLANIAFPKKNNILLKKGFSFIKRTLTVGNRFQQLNIGGKVKINGTDTFPIRCEGGRHLIDQSYIVAPTIKFPDGATVYLAKNVKNLVLIAKEIDFGENVTITWEEPELKTRGPKPFSKLPKDRKPNRNKRKKSNHFDGKDVKGGNGRNGQPLNTNSKAGEKFPGPKGDNAPTIEIWTLKVKGTPTVILKGQNGGDGADGIDGEDGGRGGFGRDAEGGLLIGRRSGPGHGGAGGNGGNGGHGGNGGDGGNGGHLKFFMPPSEATKFSELLIDDLGPGEGGDPGKGGNGGGKGIGGERGSGKLGRGERSRKGDDGKPGDDGYPGIRGNNGSLGTSSHMPITKAMFTARLLMPAIVRLSLSEKNDSTYKVGEKVYIKGHNFIGSSKGDTVLVNDKECVTEFIDSKKLSFIIPETGGYNVPVVVRQDDGTMSNPAHLSIRLQITEIVNHLNEVGFTDAIGEPLSLQQKTASNVRFSNGKEFTIKGHGFSEGRALRVRLADQPLNRTDVTFISSTELKCTMRRPANMSGTLVNIKEGHKKVNEKTVELLPISVTNTGLPNSNSVEVMLRTIQVLYIGDSVVWGQGLNNEYKFTEIVREHVATLALSDNIGVYGDMHARSGAKLGKRGDAHARTTFGNEGEIPFEEPSVFSQINNYPANKDDVRLIIMDGGANDFGVFTVLLGTKNIKDNVRAVCYDKMRECLEDILVDYPRAIVLVNGYYRGISLKSDVPTITALAAVATTHMGVVLGPVLPIAAPLYMSERSEVFERVANESLTDAVRDVNAARPSEPQRVFMSIPDFKPENAAFNGDKSYLYGIKFDPLPEAVDNGQEGMARSRKSECTQYEVERLGLSKAERDKGTSKFLCVRASMGHPNYKGALAYAEAMINIIDNGATIDFDV